MRTAVLVTAGALVAMAVLDLLLGHGPVPGFWSFYGLASCVVIVLASKWLGKHALQRDEGYYEPTAQGARGAEGAASASAAGAPGHGSGEVA
jgi:hypothetical protein